MNSINDIVMISLTEVTAFDGQQPTNNDTHYNHVDGQAVVGDLKGRQDFQAVNMTISTGNDGKKVKPREKNIGYTESLDNILEFNVISLGQSFSKLKSGTIKNARHFIKATKNANGFGKKPEKPYATYTDKDGVRYDLSKHRV